MKATLAEILCCPVCKGALVLDATKTEGDEIEEGTLRCDACVFDYPIEAGVPNLLPPDMHGDAVS